MDDKAIANLLRTLSTERRVSLLRALLFSVEPLPSSTLATLVGISDAAASYNLSELSQCGLIRAQQSGRWVFYSPNRELLSHVFKALDIPEGTPQ